MSDLFQTYKFEIPGITDTAGVEVCENEVHPT